MKAENQRKRRAAQKRGVSVKGKDYDHNRGRFVSEKVNRGATKTTNNTMAKKTSGGNSKPKRKTHLPKYKAKGGGAGAHKIGSIKKAIYKAAKKKKG